MGASEGCIRGDHLSVGRQFQDMILEVRESRLPYLNQPSHVIRAATRMDHYSVMVNPIDRYIYIEVTELVWVPHLFTKSTYNDLVVGKGTEQT